MLAPFIFFFRPPTPVIFMNNDSGIRWVGMPLFDMPADSARARDFRRRGKSASDKHSCANCYAGENYGAFYPAPFEKPSAGFKQRNPLFLVISVAPDDPRKCARFECVREETLSTLAFKQRIEKRRLPRTIRTAPTPGQCHRARSSLAR